MTVRYEVRFSPLYGSGRAFAFQCNAQGSVDINALSDKARDNYRYAQLMVGAEFKCPTVAKMMEK